MSTTEHLVEPCSTYAPPEGDRYKKLLRQNEPEEATLETIIPEELSAQRYGEILKWPIILKPITDQTCLDKKTKNNTTPIMVVNITSLFEILLEGTSELDQYLTTAFLTSLDTYYKLYNYSFNSYLYKNEFLNDILNYLQSFNRRIDIEENLNNIKHRISFSNNDRFRWSFICNKRIFDEMPNPSSDKKTNMELFFSYTAAKPCSEFSNGKISYRIGTSLDRSLPSEILDTLTDFWAYANTHQLFSEIDWEGIKTREEVIMLMIQWLSKERIINENQIQTVDYLRKSLKHDLMRALPPTIELECVVPLASSQVMLPVPAEEQCDINGFSNTFSTVYYVDLLSLFRTLRRVEIAWMQKLIPLLTSQNAAAKLKIAPPTPEKTKAGFFLELLNKLEVAHADSISPGMVSAIRSEIQFTGYGASLVEFETNCPKSVGSKKERGIQGKDGTPCALAEVATTTMGNFVHLPTLLTAFHRNTSRRLLALYSDLLSLPNSYTMLPVLTPCNVTNEKFNDLILHHLMVNNSASPQQKQFFDHLLTALNKDDKRELVTEKMCLNGHLTDGKYLRYPSNEPCTSRNFDLILSNIIASLDSDTSQSQIILLSAYFINKNKNFYEAMSNVDVNQYVTTGSLLKVIIQAYLPDAEKDERIFLQTLMPHILEKDSPLLTIVTDCSNDIPALDKVLNNDEVKNALNSLENDPGELSFRRMEDKTQKKRDLEFNAKEAAELGQRKVKEMLYALFGDDPQLTQHINTLQKTEIYVDNMYDGFDVINELPDKCKLTLLLIRYLKGIQGNPEVDREIVTATKAVLNILNPEQNARRKRGALSAGRETFNLDKLLKSADAHAPQSIQEAAQNLTQSLDLSSVTLRHPFRDLLPFILRLDVLQQIPVLLKIVYDTRNKQLSRTDLTNIKEIHNYYSTDDKDFIDVEAHYSRLVILLNGLLNNVTDSDLIESKNVIIKFVTSEKDFDRGITKIESLQLKPRDYLIRSLRRFREILNKKSNRDIVRLWVATTKILHHFQAPDHDATENEIDEDVDVVEIFKQVDDESIVQAKGTVMRYIIQNMNQLSDAFADMRDIDNYPELERASIILERLARSANKMTAKEIEAFEVMKKYLEEREVTEGEQNREKYDLQRVIEEVFRKSNHKREKMAKEYLLKAVKDYPEIFTNILKETLLPEYETGEQQLSEILRRLINKYKPKLSQQLDWAINVTFDVLKADSRDSSKDQFLGDFLPHLIGIVLEALPQKPHAELREAIKKTIEVMKKHKDEFSTIFKGIYLYKHTRDLQARIIILRLQRLPGLSEDDASAIDAVRKTLDYTSTEVEDETINESEQLPDIFQKVFGDKTSTDKIVKAQSVIMHYLSPGNKYRKTAYKGVNYKTTDIKILEQIFNNILRNKQLFDSDIVRAIRVLGDVLEMSLSEEREARTESLVVSSFERLFGNSTGEYSEALKLFLEYVKRYTSSLEKILTASGTTLEAEEGAVGVVSAVLRDIQRYPMPLSVKLRGASSLLLQNLDSVTGNKVRRRTSREELRDEREMEEMKFESLKEATLRILLADGVTS